MINKSNAFNLLIDTLFKTSPGLQAVIIVTAKGLPIASKFTRKVDDVLISAMFAAVHSMSTEMAARCSIGLMNQVIIEGENCNIIISRYGYDFILCLISEKNVKLDFISFRQSWKIFEKISSLMEEQETDSLIIERKYLLELFDKNFLDSDNNDGLPTLKSRIEIGLYAKKIKVEYKGKLIIFSKNE